MDASIHLSAGSSKIREALAQYIVRPPVSLKHLLLDEGGTDTVVYRAAYSDYFHTDTKLFPAVESLVELLQHLPDSRRRLIRTYGLYSSRARGTPSPAGALARREGGPAKGWKRDHPPQPSLRIGPPEEPKPQLSVSAKQSRAAPWPTAVSQETARGWARLIKKIYEADLPGGSRRQPAGAPCAALDATSP